MHITIIIPTFKPKAYLWECLESLDKQVQGNYTCDVLLVLNGPQEPYETEIRSYLEQCHNVPITLLYSSVLGVSAARNLALDHAKGEYITFLDDDDFVSPTYLRNFSYLAARDRIVIAKAKAFADGTNEELDYRITNEYVRHKDRGQMPALSMRSIYSSSCMKLIPREMIGDIRFDMTLRNNEDALFMFAISRNFKKAICAPDDTIYNRRVRGGSAISLSRKRKLLNAIRMLYKYTNVYIQSPFNYNMLFFITRILGTVKGVFAKDVY